MQKRNELNVLANVFSFVCCIVLCYFCCIRKNGILRSFLVRCNQSPVIMSMAKSSDFMLASSNSMGVEKEIMARKVAIAEDIIHELATEKYSLVSKRFDVTMRNALPISSLKQTWGALKSQCGSFKRIIKIQTKQTNRFLDISATCEFTLMPIDIKVAVNKDNKVCGLHFLAMEVSYETPSYVDIKAFDEIPVTIGVPPWTLPGVLSIPKGDGPFAVVVLVHGSGVHDRDETINSNKPFRDLAWGLASRGIAVLRYDKRTYVYNSMFGKVDKNFTVNEETIEDVIAGVTFLRKQDRIDKNKIYILGHSMGGMLIPRIGLRERSLAGFIIMGGNATPLEDLVVKQTEYLASFDGKISEEEKESIEGIKKKAKDIKGLKLRDIDSTITLLFGAPPAYWLDLQKYDPAKLARELRDPILILHGGRDYQISMEDFNQWKRELASKNKVKFILYPNLNHLFMEGEGKSGPLEYLKPSHVAEPVIIDIAEWLILKSGTSNNVEK